MLRLRMPGIFRLWRFVLAPRKRDDLLIIVGHRKRSEQVTGVLLPLESLKVSAV